MKLITNATKFPTIIRILRLGVIVIIMAGVICYLEIAGNAIAVDADGATIPVIDLPSSTPNAIGSMGHNDQLSGNRASDITAHDHIAGSANSDVDGVKRVEQLDHTVRSTTSRNNDNITYKITPHMRFNIASYNSNESIDHMISKVMCLNVNYELKQDYRNCFSHQSNSYKEVVASLQNATSNIIVVPSTVEQDILDGAKEFPDGHKLSDKLRFLFSLHTVPTVVVVKKSSNIQDLAALYGKTLDIGQSYDNKRIFDIWLKFQNKDTSFLSRIDQSDTDTQIINLCSGSTTAIVISATQPSNIISKVASICNVSILGLRDPILQSHNEYVKSFIGAGEYLGNPFKIDTIGSRVTVLSSSDVSESDIYTFTKIIMENLTSIRQIHPALSDLTIDLMLNDGRNTLLHDGVIKYLMEINYDMTKLTPQRTSPVNTTTTNNTQSIVTTK